MNTVTGGKLNKILSTGTGPAVFGVVGNMARLAKRDAVIIFRALAFMIRVAIQVMRSQVTALIIPAYLAGVSIALKDPNAPFIILFILASHQSFFFCFVGIPSGVILPRPVSVSASGAAATQIDIVEVAAPHMALWASPFGLVLCSLWEWAHELKTVLAGKVVIVLFNLGGYARTMRAVSVGVSRAVRGEPLVPLLATPLALFSVVFRQWAKPFYTLLARQRAIVLASLARFASAVRATVPRYYVAIRSIPFMAFVAAPRHARLRATGIATDEDVPAFIGKFFVPAFWNACRHFFTLFSSSLARRSITTTMLSPVCADIRRNFRSVSFHTFIVWYSLFMVVILPQYTKGATSGLHTPCC